MRRLVHFGGVMAVLCGSRTGYADLERVGIPRQMAAFDDRQDAYEWLNDRVKEMPGTRR
jgi:hypothetical protein